MKNTLHQDTPALAVHDVEKIYMQWQRSGKVKDILKNLFHPAKKEVRALDGLNLTVLPGDFVAYAGANGAGKSTTIKILSGILRPTSGFVRVLGADPALSRVDLMRKVGVLFGQRNELWWDYPVEASYAWKKDVWGIDSDTYQRMLNIVTDMLDLKPLLQTFARELSLGQKMRAELGMLLLHEPEVIFLDEPTLGLDVLAKKKLIAFLRHINEEMGRTILVTSHDMDDLQEMARRIVLLHQGKVTFDGSFNQLRESRKDLNRVKLVAEIERPPEIPGLTLVAHQNGKILYEYDPKRIGMGELLRGLSVVPGIADVEIVKPPIEDIIANLYRELAS